MQGPEIIVKCRVSADEQACFQQAAKKQGVSLAGWMRLHLKAAAEIVLGKTALPRKPVQAKPITHFGKYGRIEKTATALFSAEHWSMGKLGTFETRAAAKQAIRLAEEKRRNA